jgi:hypothetical protein
MVRSACLLLLTAFVALGCGAPQRGAGEARAAAQPGSAEPVAPQPESLPPVASSLPEPPAELLSRNLAHSPGVLEKTQPSLATPAPGLEHPAAPGISLELGGRDADDGAALFDAVLGAEVSNDLADEPSADIAPDLEDPLGKATASDAPR